MRHFKIAMQSLNHKIRQCLRVTKINIKDKYKKWTSTEQHWELSLKSSVFNIELKIIKEKARLISSRRSRKLTWMLSHNCIFKLKTKILNWNCNQCGAHSILLHISDNGCQLTHGSLHSTPIVVSELCLKVAQELWVTVSVIRSSLTSCNWHTIQSWTKPPLTAVITCCLSRHHESRRTPNSKDLCLPTQH